MTQEADADVTDIIGGDIENREFLATPASVSQSCVEAIEKLLIIGGAQPSNNIYSHRVSSHSNVALSTRKNFAKLRPHFRSLEG